MAASASARLHDADTATTRSICDGSTEVIVFDVRTRSPPMTAGTSMILAAPAAATASPNADRTACLRNSPWGSWW